MLTVLLCMCLCLAMSVVDVIKEDLHHIRMLPDVGAVSYMFVVT